VRGHVSFGHAFRISANRKVVFELFSDPRLLNALTPPWFDLRPIAPLPARLQPGLEISYRLRWRGLPMRWISRLTDWQEGTSFAYEQARGPYRYFRHEHLFSAVDGGTEIRDRVILSPPGGRVVGRCIALPDLRRIFTHRELAARVLLAGAQTGAAVPSASRIPWTSASSSPIERPT